MMRPATARRALLNVSTSNGNFNQFEGLGGDDTITGNGNTRVLYTNCDGGVTITIGAGGAGSASGDGSAGNDSFTGGVNSAIGSNFADTYNASAFDSGFNSIQGNGGNDTITGNGATQVQYSNATSGVTVDLAAGTATGDASVGTDIITGGVNNVFGSNFGDTLTGGSGNDFLNGGNGGNDVLNGGGGQIISPAGREGTRLCTPWAAEPTLSRTSTAARATGSIVTGVTGIYILADIQSRATQQGPNTVIDFGNGDTITLANITVGSLVAGDFVFAANGTPTDIALANSTVAENSAAGTIVGSLSAIDPDAGDTASFMLIDDADGLFAIDNGNLVVAGALDYETAASHQVTVRVTDSAGHSYDEAFTIGVTDVAEGEILGDGNDNTLTGTAGNDVIRGLGGSDMLESSAGDDLMDGGTGQDSAVYLNSTAGIQIGMASGVVTGDSSVGTDTLRSVEGVQGSNYGDTYNATGYWTGAGAPSANAGSPSLMGPVNNTFEGMGGDDVITGNGRTTASYFHATAGVTVNLSSGATNGSATSTAGGDAAGIGNDTLIGVNWVRGSEYADVLNGGAGNDVFVGGAGNDAVNGGAGFDLMTYAPTFNNTVTSGIAVNMTTGIVTGDASIGSDTLRSIESVRGTNFADTYTATNFGAAGFTNPANFNVGNNGTFNEFEGMGGNDTITGNNNTRILFWNASGAVTVDLAAGTADGDGSVGHDTFSGVVQVRGSSFNDTLLGSNNVGFTEVFDGWTGNDLIDGRGGFDQAVYNNNNPLTTSGVVVNMAAGTVVGDASIGTDTLRSIEQVSGTNFADTYDATNFGAAGFLNASTNNVGNNGTFNSFQGLGGNDTITGNGNTQIAFFNATAGVTVNLATGIVTGDGSVGTDTITGGVNNVQGSNFNDTITGGGGNEILGGGGGSDTINGGGGSDTITGGGGNDTIDGGGGGDVAVFSGPRANYAINLDVPVAGQVQVVHSGGAGADGTDVLSNVEVLQFTDGLVLLTSGSAGSPVDISGLFFGGSGALTTLTGTSDDFLTIGQSLFNRQIDLGARNRRHRHARRDAGAIRSTWRMSRICGQRRRRLRHLGQFCQWIGRRSRRRHQRLPAIGQRHQQPERDQRREPQRQRLLGKF